MLKICLQGIASIIVGLVYLRVWKKNRKREMKDKNDILEMIPKYNLRPVIYELQNPKWIKIGKVTNLHMHPLISGKACDADECQVSFDEIYMFKKGQLITWDRSFIVYDDKTKRIVTMKDFPQLLQVELSVENNYITLRTKDMITLCTELRKGRYFKCSYSNPETIPVFPKFTCSDCGDEVAEWLSRFLVGKSSSLRLGYSMSFINPLKTLYTPYYINRVFAYVGDVGNKHSLGPFINILPRNTSTINQKRQEPDEININDSYSMIYPTITISANNRYLKDKWKWIKIGDLIIKTAKPAKVKNSTFHEHGKLFGLGVNCQLYEAGYVKSNDNVFVLI